MPKLVINTEKSLYKPIEVEIDGKVFFVRRITRDILKKLEEYDARILSGEPVVEWLRLEFLFQTKSKTLDKLSLEEADGTFKFIINSIFSPEKSEKNESRPEGESLPK